MKSQRDELENVLVILFFSGLDFDSLKFVVLPVAAALGERE